MATDLEWAISEYKPSWRRQRMKVHYEYYAGRQPMAFATEKFRSAFFQVFKEFTENLCPAVVDALNDRLKVIGFRTSEAKTEQVSSPSLIPGTPPRKRVRVTDTWAQTAWDLWERNRLDLRSSEVHLEALRCGDGYVIVWPDENMEATIWPQDSWRMAIEYDSNTYGKVLRASKIWMDEVEKRWYLNIYFPDRIDKYELKETQTQSWTLPVEGPEQWRQRDQVPNPYNRVPVIHFSNQVENKYGESELKDVIPIQDALNKSDVDMLVAMEFASYKQRYIIGMEVEVDEETGEPKDKNAKDYGVDRMMAIPNEEAKVGQFEATDLGQFLRAQDKFWLSVARVTGTPLHYFYITTGDFPSGEAIKSAEGRFIKRITDRQTSFGNKWEDVIKFAMEIDQALPEDFTIEALWEPASPRSESELADTAVKKRTIGVPRSQLLREQGYDDEQIEQFLEEADAEAMARAALQMQQEPPGQNGAAGGESRDTTRARQGVPR